jgi:hypothetical protein
MRHLLFNPKYKDVWGKSYTTELGRLAQGIPGISEGTNTIKFIARDEIPMDRLKNVTYGCICANYCPEKADPNCSRLIVGGNRLNVPGDCRTPIVDMVTVKLHLNSIILTKGACYCTIDLKALYLMTPMTRPEYMHMKIKDLPEEFVTMQLACYWLSNRTQSPLGLLPKGKTILWFFQSPRRGLAVLTHRNQKDPCLSKFYIVGFAIIY